MKCIYLDYAATTPIDQRVASKMLQFMTRDGAYGNPASLHEYGRMARQAVEAAREQVAALLQAGPSEIIWTSGATESDNLALKGAAQLYQRKGKHIVTMKTEHKAVLDACQHLEKEGYLVSYLSPEADGRLSLTKLTEALREDTVLVSIMHVNNETGTIQDIDAIAQLTAARGILFHVDAAQSAGKIPLDVTETPVDLVSLSAHKAYGPKGIGALYLRKRPRVRVAPLIHGGGHEQGMRSGTLATQQIVGMGEAFYLAQQAMNIETQKTRQLRDRFLAGMQAHSAWQVNGDLAHTVPHILNLRCEGILAEAMLAHFPQLAVSTSAACQSHGAEGSHVLRAMGFGDAQVKSSVRFSLGRYTTEQEIDAAVLLFSNF